jgi:hypothetical protein
VWSPVYGKKEPITVLNFGTVADLPAEFAILLVVSAEIQDIPGKLTQVTEETPTPVKAYLYSAPSEECSFYFAEPGRTWQHGILASDAEFVCWKKKRERGEELLILCNGSYVEINGTRVLACRHRVKRCEVLSRDGGKQIYASEPEALLTDDDSLTGGKPER